MRKIFIIIAVFLPSIIKAQTIVPAVINSDLWIKQNSPYIVQSDTIVKGTLTIEPGVVVQIGDAYLDSFKIEGILQVNGTNEEPVVFESYGAESRNWSVQFRSTNHSFIKHAVFRNSLTGIYIKDATVDFEHVRFSDFPFCLGIEKGTANLVDTSFVNCTNTSIYAEQGNVSLSNSHLTGNTEDQGILLQNYSVLTVASSSIENYTNSILSDNSTITIDNSAINQNGVGISTKLSDVRVEKTLFNKNDVAVSVFKPGPIFSGGDGNAFSPKDQVIVHNSEFIDSITGDIVNTADITVDATINWWGSNDGPKKNEGNITVEPWTVRKNDCCSNVLFIPGFQASRLNLPGNQLWEPNRNADVEKLFLDERGLSSSTISIGSIIDKGIGYKIYDSLIKKLDSMVIVKKIKEWKAYPYDWRRNQIDVAKDIVPTIESLASSSATGRVSILSHSNGGLIAKALLKSLRDIGKDSLIDSLIFIAVPQLGTPKAIASLLYGYDQEIAKGLILNKKTARQFGYNAPAAYGLLPTNYTPQNGGVASSSKDLEQPITLNKYLLSEAKKVHTLLDGINFPKIFSITGWNVKTPNSLSTASLLGDGTVIASSSNIFNGGYFFDIGKYNKENKTNISHANITESQAILGFIDDVVSSSTVSDKYISKDFPIVDPEYTHMAIKMFSPVEIHAYDSEGRHTGPSLHQKEREQEMDIEPGLIDFVDEEIPNSSYDDFMDVKTIDVPRDGVYTIKGIGTDAGTFTLQTSLINSKGQEKIIAQYEDLPVLKDSNISIDIDSKKNPSDLKIDIEGDNIFETSVKPNRSKKMLDKKAFLDFCKKILPHIKRHEYRRYIDNYMHI